MGWIGHLTGGNVAFFSADMATMAPVTGNEGYRIRLRSTLRALAARARAILSWSLSLSFAASVLAIPALQAQSGGNQSQPPANSQPAQDIPDAPSTVQPPAPKPVSYTHLFEPMLNERGLDSN